jgi:hypothetical protein
MNEALRSTPRIDKEVAGQPVEAHGFIVTPVARVRGMAGATDDENGSGRYGWAAIRPVRMIVQNPQGGSEELALPNMEARLFALLAGIGLVVIVATTLIPALGRRKNRFA